ncbi:CALM [Enterospora canceri]|uniref:CALM n=1 Tax=Enterospora canceri TaxID=1081671 RepID=A0A1Y1S745_9MICR|nr:CALM [Enterospora canceri]
MFTKEQIGELRDAFNLFDADGDGKVSASDLKQFMSSIGDPCSETEIAEMVSVLEPNCNFMMLLTHLGEKMAEIGDLNSILSAFKNIDVDNSGLIAKDRLYSILSTNLPNKMSEKLFNKLIDGCSENNQINYQKLSTKIKHGELI